MRIDPSQIGAELRRMTGGGAQDAARGQRADHTAREVAPEGAFEPVDRLLLKRLALQSVEEAAGSTIRFADVQQLLERTRSLIADDGAAARTAQGGLVAERLRHLLGE